MKSGSWTAFLVLLLLSLVLYILALKEFIIFDKGIKLISCIASVAALYLRALLESVNDPVHASINIAIRKSSIFSH